MSQRPPDLLGKTITVVDRWMQSLGKLMRPLYLNRGERLICAAGDGDLERVKTLLAADPDPNARHNAGEACMHNNAQETALHRAVTGNIRFS